MDCFNSMDKTWATIFTYCEFTSQMTSIINSQSKNERIFSMGGVITSLWSCWFGIENIDELILIMKNWP